MQRESNNHLKLHHFKVIIVIISINGLQISHNISFAGDSWCRKHHVVSLLMFASGFLFNSSCICYIALIFFFSFISAASYISQPHPSWKEFLCCWIILSSNNVLINSKLFQQHPPNIGLFLELHVPTNHMFNCKLME